MKKNKYILSIFVVLFIIYMLLYPADALAGSKTGLLLWFQTVLPTLLPFMILSNLLLASGFTERVPAFISAFFRRLLGLSPNGCYAFLLGIFCGYPMGGKITADLYRTGLISRSEADFLLTFTNNVSPMFILTFIIQENLKHPEHTLRIFFILYFSTFCTGQIFRLLSLRKGRKGTCASVPQHKKETSHPLPIGEMIDVSIMNSFETITRLGGYIILCSILVTAIQKIPDVLLPLKMLLESTAEISTGIHTISLRQYEYPLQFLFTLCAASFGGFCVMLQTKSILKDTDLTLTPYIKGKLVQTFLTALLALAV